MNKSYRSVYNEQTGAWVAVAETTKSNGKKSGLAITVATVVAGLTIAGAAEAQIAISQTPTGSGTGAVAGTVDSVAIGSQAVANPGPGSKSTAVGSSATASGGDATAIGDITIASGGKLYGDW